MITKKIMLIFLIFEMTHHITAMESSTYSTELTEYESHLFFTCKHADVSFTQRWIERIPTININIKDCKGRTPLLRAAYKYKLNTVELLLQHNADKTIKDNNGQSLFSLLLYNHHLDCAAFHKLLTLYTYDEITHECTTIPLKKITKRIPYLQIQIDDHIHDVLTGKKDIHSTNHCEYTAIQLACIDCLIPIIIKLLQRGADIFKPTTRIDHSPYKALSYNNNKSLFVIREALSNGTNNEAIKNAALLSSVFNNNDENSLTNQLLPEITNTIKKFYVKTYTPDLTSPEARMWKPVCVDACKLADINETDENTCLTKLILLSQHKKTEINLLLLKEGK